ncbi:MAG TPA: DUF2268 domain-containing putative Zn-dependent protease [Candidatus Sulfotelmatobacter sp.]|nr:DUF2268 domain-containing putative Zn-dependent protease [Candidatus Sulfotelmatobacter sp.]
MQSINYYVANSHGKFTPGTINKIQATVNKSTEIIKKQLGANKIDIIFVNAPLDIIPEIGIGGYSHGPYNIYVSLDPDRDFREKELILTILHEAHHCMRWRGPGYGKNLGEALVTEGLACLYEEEYSGKAPIYTKVEIKPEEIAAAREYLNDDKYVHKDWFFGSDKAQRWFGYTYGYSLVKTYAKKANKKASELVTIPADIVLAEAQLAA